MDFKITFYRSGTESKQPVAIGQVPGVCWAWHTIAYATGDHFVVDRARWQPAASEPGPLSGEGELKQKRLEKEIGELAETLDSQWAFFLDAETGSDDEKRYKALLESGRSRLIDKERELAAVVEEMRLRTDASPDSYAGSADRTRTVKDRRTYDT